MALGFSKKSDSLQAYYTKDTSIEETKKKVSFFEDKENAIVSILVIAMIFNCIALVIAYIVSIANVEQVVLTNNAFYIIVIDIGCPLIWLFSTSASFWAFRKRKRMLLYTGLSTMVLASLQPIYTLVWNYLVTWIFTLHPTAALTTGMIILLARVVLGGIIGAIIFIILSEVAPYLAKDQVQQKINTFKLKEHIDDRKNKENLFDANFIKSLETGKDIIIKYKDRFLHMLIDGASGTGKTSSCFQPQIFVDLVKKTLNRSKRQRELLKMLLQRKVYVKKHWKGRFDESYIAPIEGYEEKYHDLLKQYPDCGITVVAPDNSTFEDIVKMCAARDIMVNIADPVKSYSKYRNVREIGINPFYIEPGHDEDDTANRIINQAQVFADVMIALNTAGGKVEVYFIDIARSVSQNIAIACMLYAHMQGRQTNLTEVQDCINDFTKLKPYISYIEEELGIRVDVEDPKAKKDNKNASSDKESYAEKKKQREAEQEKDSETIERERAEKLENEERSKESPYYQTIVFIKTELLGGGATDMFTQARGLRNLVNNLIINPRIKRILSAKSENRLDFDETLSKAEITLVNTGQELSKSISTGFGLFYILSHRVAVFRRNIKEGEEKPHFLMIDEASQYMHEVYEDMINQYRKFSVGVTLAIQSLSQTQKNDNTKWMKNVFLKCGTIIAFGRLEPEEMEIYQSMSGSREIELPQTTTAQTSIMQDDPTISHSVRVTPTQKAYIEGSDMRLMSFQEVTVIGVDEGRGREGRYGKVDFLSPDAFNRVDTDLPDFSSFNPDDEDALDEIKKPWEERKRERDVDDFLNEEPKVRPVRGAIANDDSMGVPELVLEKTMETEIKNEDEEEPSMDDTTDMNLADLFFTEENENIPQDADSDATQHLKDLNQKFAQRHRRTYR